MTLVDHAIVSSKIFMNFIDDNALSNKEKEILRQAIIDHSKGGNIQSLVGLALVLADKLDVTYHRTENSSIQDTMNKEIQKIKKVDIKILDTVLIVNYETVNDFNNDILNYMAKSYYNTT